MTDRATVRVGIIGKDARTDCLAGLCSTRSDVKLFSLSQFNIPGLVAKSESITVVESVEDCSAILDWAERVEPDLVVIGPEEPLAAGVADVLESKGIACFGPRQSSARIESSKIWARQLVQNANIGGNPDFWVFSQPEPLRQRLSVMSEFVVKPDGLTGGKGVRVYPEHFATREEAVDYAESCISTEGRVLVEERLIGQEFSLQTVTDGKTWFHCPVVQDHKRAYCDDTGPNTGGMGSYSWPNHGMPFLTDSELQEAHRINEDVIAALREETGEPYRGVLYGGFIATSEGVRLIEYNSRFGDPEVLNVMEIMEADFVEIARAVATGTLASVQVAFRNEATVCKYIVPDGYPNGTGNGDPVVVPPEIQNDPQLSIHWAACEQEPDGRVSLTGSRGLAVVGSGASVAEAEAAVEAAAVAIGEASKSAANGKAVVRHRSDIGTERVLRRRVEHMASIRGHEATFA